MPHSRDILQWFIHSNTSLWLRIGLGVLIFTCMALVDWHRNGPRATRWREYLFLLASVLIALLYGVINDQLTSRLSWEYFYYGKDLAAILGPRTPPDPARLSWRRFRWL